MPDTNFKEMDPKRQKNSDEGQTNRKHRGGNYDGAHDADPSDGYRDTTDEAVRSDEDLEPHRPGNEGGG